MAKFLSDRQQSLKVGISSYTENKTVLQTIGKVGIGTTNSGGRSLYVIGDTEITGVITATTFSGQVNAGVGIITTLNFTTATGSNIVGTALSVSGIGSVTTLIASNIVGTALSVSGIGSVTTLIASNIVGTALSVATGIATIRTINASNIVGTALSVSTGIATIGTINASNIVGTALSVATGIATIGTINASNIVGTALSVSTGIATIGTINFTTATGSNIVGTALSVAAGIATIGTINFTTATGSNIVGTALSVSGIGSVTTLISSNIVGTALSVATGIATIGTINFTTATGSNIVGTALSVSAGISTLGVTATTSLTAQRLNVSGISTLQTTTIIGGGTSTGTVGQVLQVTGISSGAYIGGSVGIGTTNPTQPLDVNGNARLRGGIYDSNNSFGGSNNVLSSNGSGGWSWQPVTSVGATSGVSIADDTSTNATRYILFTNATSGLVNTENVSSTKLTYNPSSGSLGINTTTPTQPLDVNGNARLRGGIYDSGNSSGGSNTVLTSNGSGGWSWQSIASIGSSSGVTIANDTSTTTPQFLVFTNATSGFISTESVSATKLTYIASSSSLGIGTTNPTVTLQLSPNSSISNVGFGITLVGTAGVALTVAQFFHSNGNASYLRIKATRNTTGGDWTTASTKLVQVIDGTEQSYIEYNPNGANYGMSVGAGTSEWARFLQSGNLGIGTTNPSQTLHVQGNARVTGGIYDANSSSGSPNNVLTSNGSGGWSWQAVGAIGGSNIAIDATDTTDISRFLVFTKISSGSTATQYVSTNGLVFNPSSGNLGIGSTLPTSKLTITGDVSISGVTTSKDFNSSSDITLKKDIIKIENPLATVEQLRGVKFTWKSNEKKSIGVIAQELEEVLPELVSQTDVKSVNYNGLIGVLIEAVKELSAEVKELKAQLNN
jgi:hypothetical protein